VEFRRDPRGVALDSAEGEFMWGVNYVLPAEEPGMSLSKVCHGGPTYLGVVLVWALVSVALVAADDERLITAVKAKEFDSVATILKEETDVNATTGDGTTALHWASHWGDVQTVARLIKSGARVNAQNTYGVTPLMLACENKDPAVVDALLDAHANPNLARASGETALMMAASTSNPRIVHSLLQHGADVNAKERRQDQTALMVAASAGHPAVVRALVQGGADIHARTRVTRSVVNRGDPGGRRTGYVSVGDAELGGYTSLLFAARRGDVDSAQILLDAGARIDDHTADGMTSLILAAYGGHAPLAALLLARGADPNDSGPGYTALHAAVLRGSVDVVALLVGHGADVDARLVKGTPIRRMGEDWVLPETLRDASPTLLAAKFLEHEVLELLVRARADLKMSAADGSTALTYAVGGGPEVPYDGVDRRSRHVPAIVLETTGAGSDEEARVLAVVKLLVERGVDVNVRDVRGDTAVHHAVRKGFSTVLQFLAESGADLTTRTK
jgi:uncharacterized protein